MKVVMITKEGYRRKLFLAVSLIILITSCSPSQVDQRTKISSGFLAADVATCRQKATALIDRELKLDSSYDRSGSHQDFPELLNFPNDSYLYPTYGYSDLYLRFNKI